MSPRRPTGVPTLLARMLALAFLGGAPPQSPPAPARAVQSPPPVDPRLQGLPLSRCFNAYELTWADDMDDLERFVRNTRAHSAVGRLSAAHMLLQLVDDPTPGQLRRPEDAERFPSLRTVGGRAAMLFDRILAPEDPGPPPGPDAGPPPPGPTNDQRRQLLRSLRAQAVTLARDYRAGLTDEEAGAKYRGRLYVGETKAERCRSSGAIDELLKEWFPLGRTVADVEAIFGVPMRPNGTFPGPPLQLRRGPHRLRVLLHRGRRHHRRRGRRLNLASGAADLQRPTP